MEEPCFFHWPSFLEKYSKLRLSCASKSGSLVFIRLIREIRGESPRFGLADGRTTAGLNAMSDLSPLPTEPTPGLYRHYKGNEYRVIGLARHSETLETLVVYQALYGAKGLWVRPVAMFAETVQIGGRCVPRFERIGE